MFSHDISYKASWVPAVLWLYLWVFYRNGKLMFKHQFPSFFYTYLNSQVLKYLITIFIFYFYFFFLHFFTSTHSLLLLRFIFILLIFILYPHPHVHFHHVLISYLLKFQFLKTKSLVSFYLLSHYVITQSKTQKPIERKIWGRKKNEEDQHQTRRDHNEKIVLQSCERIKGEEEKR